ncbi:MAG: DNA polymerase III subunit alpha [Bacteroidales bacterium]|nr:DNA polymerase III subunit alpha [Bacteroidales bacterium]
MPNFTHLHVHSTYSILDGMSPISGLVNKCIASGMNALALTDHGNMFGIKEFFDYVSKINAAINSEIKEIESDIKKLIAENEQTEKIIELQKLIETKKKNIFKPIFGCEVYVTRKTPSNPEGSRFIKEFRENISGDHLILLAKNKIGYYNLCKLVSLAWIEGEYLRPRIDKEILEKYKEGLIVSSACLAGEIHKKIEANNYEAAKEAILWFKEIFKEDYYLELQRHQTEKKGADTTVYKQQMNQNAYLMQLARDTDTKLIATNDVHFVEEEHGEAHDRLICLSTGKKLEDTDRMRYTQQEWLKTPEEMALIFSDIPEALENTQEIVDKVDFYDINHEAMMPKFEIPVEFGTLETHKQKYSKEDLIAEFELVDKAAKERIEKLGGIDALYRIKLESDYLKELTMIGAKQRYGENVSANIIERIEFELKVMRDMGYPGYFLIVQDLIQAARNMGVTVGPGRGSAAGSVVAYCLQITSIDPMRYDLLFERFLNPDRISLPDIDIDFDDEGRGKVLDWVTEKYGEEKVAHIITYGTMAAKSSIKDVARVQDVPLDIANKLAKFIPNRLPEDPKTGKIPKVNLKNSIEMVPELKMAFASEDKMISDTLKYASMLEGTVRQIGVHACGIIIGAEDLINVVPLCTAKDKDSNKKLLVTQYEGSVIESVGLIKMDFLGLKTLSIINEALSNIKKSKKISIDIDNIPIDDEKTYRLFSEGATIGTFQFESIGMQKYLRELKPTKFEDLIAMNALYRPGPMQYIPQFIHRKQGKEEIEYEFPEMELRLKETYGITVYQEQVMLLSRDLAGFTRGQSDELRKVMGKKLKDKMATLKIKFIKGALDRGFGPKEKLEKIWKDWTEFANYAFNKSHATCYSWIAYQTAYLKAHYPAEFLAANLTHNISDISQISILIDECKRIGSPVLGPDINESELHFTVNSKGEIRFGLAALKGVGEAASTAIINERSQNGIFTSVIDFIQRINLRTCNKRCLEALAMAGVFDSFGNIHRAQFFAEVDNSSFIEKLIRYGSTYQSKLNSTQISMFDELTSSDNNQGVEFPKCEPWTDLQQLHHEKEICGFYISGHPLDKYKLEITNFASCKISSLHEEGMLRKMGIRGQIVSVAGVITEVFIGETAKRKKYGRITVEDYDSKITLSLFGENYLKLQHFFQINEFVYIDVKSELRYERKGEFDDDFDYKVINIQLLDNVLETYTKSISIQLNLDYIDEKLIYDFNNFFKISKGNTPVQFRVYDLNKNLDIQLSCPHKVNISDFCNTIQKIPYIEIKLLK